MVPFDPPLTPQLQATMNKNQFNWRERKGCFC